MWKEIATDKWYIGSRTRKGCHPNDGYICSSKTVKPMIEANPDGWRRRVLFVGDALKALEMEAYLLTEMRAKQCGDSYNKHNQNKNFHGIRVVFDEKRRKYLSDRLKGRPSPNKGNTCPNVGESNKRRTGKKRPDHSAWMTGRTWTCLERTCEHCGTTGRGGNMLRYHFENCKQKGNKNGPH